MRHVVSESAAHFNPPQNGVLARLPDSPVLWCTTAVFGTHPWIQPSQREDWKCSNPTQTVLAKFNLKRYNLPSFHVCSLSFFLFSGIPTADRRSEEVNRNKTSRLTNDRGKLCRRPLEEDRHAWPTPCPPFFQPR